MTTQATTSAVTSTAPAGGGNGAGTPAAPVDPRLVLTAMLAQGDSVTQTAPEESPEPGATPSPETPPAPGADGTPGQETLPPETPPAEGTETPEAGEPKNEPPPTDDAELTQALAGLSPTERASALEIVKTLQPGEIPRIAKLVSQRNQAEQALETLQKQNEELTAQLESGATVATPQSPFPPTVAKLKTVPEVQARLEVAEANADALQDFLDANPGSADTTYTIEGQEFTRQQLIEKRAGWRAELKALPKREAQLRQQTQFTQARQATRAQIVQDFPELQDPENADAKLAQQLVSGPKFADEANADYLALALARGHRELQAELAARKARNGNGHAKPPFGTPPKPVVSGKVPTGKPSAPAGGAAPRPAPAAVKLSTALDRNRTERSIGSLAGVLAASGR